MSTVLRRYRLSYYYTFPPSTKKKKKIFPLVRSFFLLFNCLGSTTCSRTLLPGTSPHLYPRVRCSFGPSVLFECGHVCSDSPTPRLHLLFFQLNPKGRTEERTKTRAQNYEIGSWVKASRRHHSLFNRMVDALFFIIFTAPPPRGLQSLIAWNSAETDGRVSTVRYISLLKKKKKNPVVPRTVSHLIYYCHLLST